MKLNRFIFLVVNTLFFVTGCSNLTEDISKSSEFNGSEEKKIIVNGAIEISSSVPHEIYDIFNCNKQDSTISRSAIPEFQPSYTKYVTATCNGKTPLSALIDNENNTFSLSLTPGSWTIKAGIKDASENELLSDSATKIIEEGDSVININFVLKPVLTGNGKVFLNFKNSTDSELTVKYTITDSAQSEKWPVEANQRTFSIYSGITFQFTTVNNIPAGCYDITFNFYNGNDFVYSTTQSVNVYPNLQTSRWISGNTTSTGIFNIIDGSGNYNITQALIDTFARTTFYVDGSKGSDTAGTGGPYSPVKSLSKAVSLADSSMEEGTKSIFVKAGGNEILAATLEFSEDINVEVYTSAVGDRIGQYTVTRPATSEDFTDQMVKINSGSTVSLAGIVIDGNKYQGALNGMGIYSSGNLSLKNCVVRNCVTTGNGGGIYIDGGTVTLDNNTLIGLDSENCATNSEYSNSAGAGGGIYVATSGKLFNYGKVSFNYASKSSQYGGGGIYVSSSGYLECSGEICYNRAEYTGGGICSKNEAIIDECKIYENEAEGAGGGIWASSNLTLKDSVIENCSVPEGNEGNGIFLSSVGNNFKIKGSTYIGEESDIFISAGDVITIEENLTPKDENGIVQTTVAYLNISDAQADRNILSATTEALLKENIDKFEIKTPRWGLAQGSGTDSTKGQLKPVVYVAGTGSSITGSDITGNGTKVNPYATINKAVETAVAETKIYIAGTQTIASGIEITKNYSLQKWPGSTSEAKIKYTSDSGRLFRVSALKKFEISDIDIEGPDVQSSQSAGAAIYNSGTLILNNVNLSKFKISTDTGFGGCLYNAAGTISITGGSIKECEGFKGGAIYNDGADIEIKNCIINKCKATSGGAIYNSCDKLITLKGNTVIGEDTGENATNANYGNSSSNGGAVYMSEGTLKLTENTVIARNYSAGNGGGVYLGSGAKVYLQDYASIKNCTAATNGSGIYASAAMCRVYMKDSAYLDSASDIRLNANGYVSLNGDLTPPDAANGIAATLTPQFYDPDDDPGLGSYIQLLNSEPIESGFVAGNYSRFKVKEKRSGEYVIPYCISSAGKLTGISQAYLAELVSSFDSSNKYLITISDPNPDFTTLYDALKNSRAQFKLDLSQTTITTLASGSLHDMYKMIDVSFPSTLTTLEPGSIYSLSSSLTIKIPASVTTITGNPFAKVTASISSLSVIDTSCNITLEEGNSNYKMIDGVIYTNDGKRLVCYPKSKTNATFTIPDGVEVIGYGAFAGNSKLTEVIFNDGLKTIEESAFAKLTKNKKVVLPSSVTTIGDYSFSRNYVLETLTITGGQLYTIGEGAFAYLGTSAQGAIKDCKVTIGEGVSEIGNDAFGMCYIDSSTEDPLVLPASLTKIGSYNFDRGKVKFIKSLAVVPPEVGSSSLYSTGIQIIYVPSSSVDAYKAANKWRDYSIVGF